MFAVERPWARSASVALGLGAALLSFLPSLAWAQTACCPTGQVSVCDGQNCCEITGLGQNPDVPDEYVIQRVVPCMAGSVTCGYAVVDIYREHCAYTWMLCQAPVNCQQNWVTATCIYHVWTFPCMAGCHPSGMINPPRGPEGGFFC